MSVDQYRAIDYSSFSSRSLGEFPNTFQHNAVETELISNSFASSNKQIPTTTGLPVKSEQNITKSKLETEEFQSIYESYNAFNEAERIQQLDYLTPAQKQYYISENVMAYLEEFVAQIRIKKLSGVIKDDGSMEILGTNVTEMYNHAAELAGEDSREEYEKKGLDLMMKKLSEGENRAIWVSPPKLKGANYGFAFSFTTDSYNEELGGKPFREMLLRYTEPDSKSISNSKNLYQSLTNRLGIGAPIEYLKSYKDFLSHPLVYSHDGFEDIEALYDYLDISPEDVRRSEDFRKQVMPIIEPYLSHYTQLIQQMSTYDLQNADQSFAELEQQANDYIGAMFNSARIIKRSMDKTVHSKKSEQDTFQLQKLKQVSNTYEMMLMAQDMARYEALVMQGGSNCEVTKKAGMLESSFLSNVVGGASIGLGMEVAGSELFSPKNEQNYKYDKRGKCQACEKSHTEVGLLGPCYVCRGCTEKDNRKQRMKVR